MSPRVSIRLLPSQSDGRLVELAGRGHERAFETLVQRYRRPLLRYCRRMGLSDARAEDVLQQSLTKAWLALNQGKEVRDLRPWLYRIVHNDAVNSVLRAPAEHEQLPDGLASASSLERDLEGRQRARETLEHVASLPRMQRHAIVLTAIDGHSHDEAARALGITDGAVRGLLHRARTTLRSAAAAVMPPGLLLRWRGIGGLGERASELSVSGGAVGATGFLLKGAAMTATVGLLALSAGAGRSVDRAGRGAAHHHASRSAAAAGPDSDTTAGAHVSALVGASSEVGAASAIGRVRGHDGGEHHRSRRGRLRGTQIGTSGETPVDSGQVPGEQQQGEDEGIGHGGDRDESGQGGSGRDGEDGGLGRAGPPAGGAADGPSSGRPDSIGEGRSERGSSVNPSEDGGFPGPESAYNALEQRPAPSDEAASGAAAGSTRGGGDDPGRGDGPGGESDTDGGDGGGN